MSVTAVWISVVLCQGGAGETSDLREALRDPERLFPAFQRLVGEGLFTKAYNNCLSAGARRAVSAEEFQVAFSSLEPARRLVAALRVHRADVASGYLLVCGPEFGVRRRIGLERFLSIYVMDLTRADIEYFLDRAKAWLRLQLRRADGWHFAYPPDWSYAPVARNCGCGI